VRLLFDENPRFRLVELLAVDFPGSAHVRSLGLRGAPDAAIWEHARTNGFVIASKDNDFRQRSFVEGPSPKVVWLAAGNAGSTAIAALLRHERSRLEDFDRDPDTALVVAGDSLRFA